VYRIILIFILTILTWYNLYYRHAATIPNWYSEIIVTFYSVILVRTIRLPDDGPRTETCRSVFNVLTCKFYKKFYICAVVGIIIEWVIISSFTIVDMSTFLPAALLMADAMLPRGLNDFRRVRKTAKVTISFVMSVYLSVRPSAWNWSAPTGRNFMKCYIFRKPVAKIQRSLNLIRITCALHEHLQVCTAHGW